MPPTDATDPGYVARQYGDTSRLAARIRLHAEFTVSDEPFPAWLLRREAPGAGDVVLDAGCGRADMWSHAGGLAPGARLVLVDSSPAMAAAARAAVGHLAAEVAVADVRRLPLPDESCDVVVANHMLYHVPDRPAALAELRRVLRPGGRFHAATNGATHMRELDALVGAPHVHSGFTLEDGAGQLAPWFEDVRLHRHPEALRITDPAPAVDYLASYHDLDGAARHRVAATIAAAIEREGAFAVTKAAGVFTARRP